MGFEVLGGFLFGEGGAGGLIGELRKGWLVSVYIMDGGE